MKIQKGIVKYKDRTDIVCTYGETEAGVQYYFLDEKDEKKFSNGNRIASTELVEAIDPMYKASHVGVIDGVGNVVIPFDNKSIRPVNDDIILVEKAQPVSQSVIEAVNLKSDPLAATKLVSTPATIKDKLNSKMGPEGRYVFNDQFSEATVCDINGNNLVNDEYFSFIGYVNNKLYFSKNTVDSEITEYSILPPEVQSDVTPASDTKEIDVSSVSVPQDVIENALSNDNVQSSVVGDESKSSVEEEHVQEAVQKDSLEMPSVVADNEDNNENNNVDDLDSTMNIPFPTNMAPDEIDALAQGIDDGEEALASETVSENVNLDETATSEVPVAAEDTVVAEEADTMQESAIPAEVAEAEETTTSEEETDVVEESIAPEEPVAAEDTVVTEEADTMQESVIPAEVAGTEETTIPEEETDAVEESVALEEPVAAEDTVAAEEADTMQESVIPTEVAEAEETTTSEEEADVVEENDAVPGDDISVSTEDIDFKLDLDETTNDSDLETSEISEDGEISANSTDDTYKDTVFDDSDLEDDVDIDKYRDSFGVGEVVSTRDNIMEDVAKSMTSLIAQNREQKAKIARVEQENVKLRASRQNILDKASHQEKKMDALVGKLKSLEGILSKMEATNHAFENKIHEQERMIASQNRELETMRTQLQGKEDLVKLLADAQTLLGQDSTFDYGTDDSYYRKVA